jgi:hypothetical protein
MRARCLPLLTAPNPPLRVYGRSRGLPEPSWLPPPTVAGHAASIRRQPMPAVFLTTFPVTVSVAASGRSRLQAR